MDKTDYYKKLMQLMNINIFLHVTYIVTMPNTNGERYTMTIEVAKINLLVCNPPNPSELKWVGY